MKTVKMERDFPYRPFPQQSIMYQAGKTYRRVPEAAVAVIVAAGAGHIVQDEKQGRRRDSSG